MPAEAKRPDVDFALAQALFCKHYPGLYLHALWPTSDHVIPWGRFWLLYLQIPEVATVL